MNNAQNKSTEAHKKAVQKYRDKTYKRLAIDYKPEQINDIRTTAKAEGLSMAAYIWELHKQHKEHNNI